jgi:hypothetical protein
MGDWATVDGQGTETAGVVPATSTGVVVASNASTNTKGNWVELTAATARPAIGILVGIRRGHSAVADFLVDIGIGAAAAEVVIVPNLKGDSGTNTLTHSCPLFIPIGIAAGTRIAARCQATISAAASRVQVTVIYGSMLTASPLSRVTDYGTNLADSGGVSVDPGASINTKGSWVQIVASTTNPIRMLMVGLGNGTNSTRTAYDWLLDIGIGPAASEIVLLGDQHLEAHTSDDLISPTFIGPFPCNIPAGTRLAARTQCSGADATDRLCDVLIYGVS